MTNITRKAEADWSGNLSDGHGVVTTGSMVLTKQPFSFGTRTEPGDQTQTNPEELIAAGLASCFSMALSKTLQDDDTIAQKLVVQADVTLSITDSGPSVDKLRLDVAAMIGGYDQTKLEQAVATTQDNCPVYQLLRPGFKSIDVEVKLTN